MDLNIVHKIFPLNHINNQKLLQYDLEGIWSISLPQEAEIISQIIKKNVNNWNKIFDGTGGLGGNIISFSKHFKQVIACEINEKRIGMLKNNLDVYGIKNVYLIHGDCLNNIDPTSDAYFFDPPWGGPKYKLDNKITLKLGNYKLVQVIELIRKLNNSPIFMKLPGNYDLEEFNQYNYQIDKIKNYFIISIY
jgi:16S rRNA G966 N2-methylase RsmD